jgi:hypothetical protein
MIKIFIKKVIILSTFPVIVLFLIGIFLPTTPRASKSLLMAEQSKKALLKNTNSPRIIFIGGSNLSFGLNSKTIKDSLKINPINTAIHASIGIKFMLDNTLEYIQNGDIVVLALEYIHYYRSLNFGSEELMRTIFDVNLANIKHLNIIQFINILQYLPKYSLTKLKKDEYLNVTESDVYSVNSFNQFGDTYSHWRMKSQDFEPYDSIKEEFNSDVLKYIEKFNIAVLKKGGILLVSFPGFQETSFNKSKLAIQKVEYELLKSSLTVIGRPERYKIPDTLMFNTPYHLNKKGVDYRTKLLIEDIEKALSHNKVLPKSGMK